MKKLLTTRNIFIAGIILLIVGFIFLMFVDKNAQNIFGFLAPFTIVSGLITIAVSFLF